MGKLLLDEILARLDALEAAAFGRPHRRLSKKALAAQRGCSTRQVMRDVERKVLPPRTRSSTINSSGGRTCRAAQQARPGRHARGQGASGPAAAQAGTHR